MCINTAITVGSRLAAAFGRERAGVSVRSVFQHFEDFSKGVVDTQHVVYYLSVIAFGLFLTARSVDADRWRG